MDRERLDYLNRRAEAGERVCVPSRNSASAIDAMREVRPSPGARVRRARGAERIDYPSGGRIYFRTPSASMRGLRVQAVVTDELAARA